MYFLKSKRISAEKPAEKSTFFTTPDKSPKMSLGFVRGFFMLFLLLSFTHLSSQNNPDTLKKHDVRLLKHYSILALNEMEANNPVKYNTITYYYTQSYIVESIECTNCVPADPAYFDIAAYETLRKKSERVVMTYKKYGIRLTLFSIDELKYKLPTQELKR